MSVSEKFQISDVQMSTISQEQLKRYAKAAGDPNPIHLDEDVAKKMGLPGVIAHGMLIAAFLAKRATAAVKEGHHPSVLKKSSTRFKSMTLLGDTISVGGTGELLEDGSLRLDLIAKSQTGETKATAQFIFCAK